MSGMRYLFLAFFIATLSSSVQAAGRSAASVLNDLDAAKTTADFHAALNGLKQLGPEFAAALESYGRDESKEARRRMLVLRFALDRQQASAAQHTLRDLVKKDKDNVFRALCAEEMGRRGSMESKSVLKNIITDKKEDPQVQIAAAVGLAEMNDDSGKEIAVKAVVENEPWANTAMRALEKLQAPDVIERIDQAGRNASSSESKGTALVAAARIRAAGKTGRDLLDFLDQSLKNKDSRELRKWAAMSMAEIGTPEAGKRLAVATKSGNSSMAAPAARGLRMGIERKKWSKENVKKWIKTP